MMVQAGVDEISVYILSRNNLLRSDEELKAIFDALPDFAAGVTALCNSGILGFVRIVGEEGLVPDASQQLMNALSLKGHAGATLNILFAYDSWSEIERVFLQTSTPHGLADFPIQTPIHAVVRSGGGWLLSGFLPLHCSYAHLVVTERLYNELTDEEISTLIFAASSTQQLYGK